MRIACLHLPGFALQVAARGERAAPGEPLATLATGPDGARVSACSLAARAAGVRAGMTAERARLACPAVRLRDADPRACREVAGRLADALLELSPAVEARQLGAVYAVVPARQSSRAFAARALAAAGALGLRARVGVAGERFTAWAATQARPRVPVRVVPAGESARFLAPLDLELLPLDEDVRRTLRVLGVTTMADFAALPPPSVVHPGAHFGVAAQAMARGEDLTPLEPYRPAAHARPPAPQLSLIY